MEKRNQEFPVMNKLLYNDLSDSQKLDAVKQMIEMGYSVSVELLKRKINDGLFDVDANFTIWLFKEDELLVLTPL